LLHNWRKVIDVARPNTRAGNGDRARQTLRWRYLPQLDTLTDVRSRVRTALRGWGVVGRAAEDVVLIVSELVANAIEHAHTPLVVALGREEDRMHIRVRDYSLDPPVMRLVEDDPRRGWGLRLIAMLATWGSEPLSDGKTVWAVVEQCPPGLQSVQP
jgi:anti-sigma regulatory factor (Ser/Thr protein kinase)